MIGLFIMLCLICLVDYKRQKIPNLYTAMILMAGLGRGLYQGGVFGAGEYLLVLAVVTFLLYPLFRIGGLGAGDVKLLCTCAGYFPVDKVFSFLFISMLMSAMFSIVKLFRERNVQDRAIYFVNYCADVVKNGRWRLYMPQKGDKKLSGICMSGPILCSVLLRLGGVY